MKLVALIAVLLLIVACENRATMMPPTTSLTPLPTSATFAPVTAVPVTADPSVPWDNYPPGTSLRLAGLAELGDCDGLRAEFAYAYGSHDDQRDRTGVGNEALLVYLDALLKEADCY